jgi:threonine aldolase
MREAIAQAPVGDDVYSDDPTVNSLEERVAAMFGKEAGVFTPTGSLANQLAIRMLVAPGEELIAETIATLFAQNLVQQQCLAELLHVHFRPKMAY